MLEFWMYLFFLSSVIIAFCGATAFLLCLLDDDLHKYHLMCAVGVMSFGVLAATMTICARDKIFDYETILKSHNIDYEQERFTLNRAKPEPE